MPLNKFPRRSLTSRITLFTLVIFVAGIWSLTYYTSRMLRHDMQQLMGEQQFSTASFIAQEVNAQLNERLRALEGLARNIAPGRLADAAAVQSWLETQTTAQALFNGGVLVVGSDGIALADVPRSTGRIGINFSDRDHIVGALKEGKATIGRPFIGAALKAPIFAIGVPIRDYHGTVIGALSGVTNLGAANFLDRITEGRYGKTGGYVLFSRPQRLIVTATDKKRIMEPLPAPGINPTIDRFLAGFEGSAVFINPQGVEVLSSVKSIPLANWIVAAVLPTTEALAPIRDMQLRILVATLVLTLLAGALTWLMLRRQLAPIVDTARLLGSRTATTQFPQLLPIVRHDEVGELIHAFNCLLASLAQKEEALRESALLLRESQVIGGMGSYALDIPAGVWTSSEVCDRVFGIDAAYPRTVESWTALVHPADRDMMSNYFLNEVLARHQPFDKEYRIVRPGDQAERWVHGMGKLEFDAQDQALKMHGTIIDITERKQAETSLREAYDALHSILDTTMDGYWCVDTAGKLIDVNPTYCQQSGYRRDELLGMRITDLEQQEAPADTAARLRRIMKTGRDQFASMHRRKDGSLWHVEVSTTFRNSAGGQFFVFVRDISQRREAEAELDKHRHHLAELVLSRTAELAEAKEAAEAANRIKSAFLANMSHEIRTPMNGILGMAHLLRLDGVTPAQAHRLDKIDAAAEHLLAIINDILDLSKIEAGKFVLEAAPITVEALLGSVGAIVSERARAKGLQLVIETACRADLLLGDPTRLKQALLNYTSNAIKFTEHGSVTLRSLTEQESDDSVLLRFEVRDTGIGIAAEALSRLFSAFEQADNSTTRKYGGTGLGLAITQRLAQLMGGEAGAESTVGVGSSFWFTARLKKARAAEVVTETAVEAVTEAVTETAVETAAASVAKSAADPVAATEPAPAATALDGRILVVDDEPLNREIAQLLLEAQGFAVDSASDGEEAVQMARQTPYAVILMDMQMPRLNGLDATARIRELRRHSGPHKSPQHADPHIIALTGNAFAEDRTRCLAAGMNDFLAKPYTPDELYAAIRKGIVG